MRGTLGPRAWFQLHRALGVRMHHTCSRSLKRRWAVFVLTVSSLGEAYCWSYLGESRALLSAGPALQKGCACARHCVPPLQVVASATIVAGFGLGLKMWVVLRSAIDGLLAAHMGIGIAVVALVILQALAVIARPKPGSRIRCCAACYRPRPCKSAARIELMATGPEGGLHSDMPG